jgi:sec-independent protein translocase protein TatC
VSKQTGEMPFLDHLEELRWRIIWCVVATLVGSAVGIFLVLRFDVVELLTLPLDAAIAGISTESPDLLPYLGGDRLNVINLTEPFFFAMKVGVALGFLLASPVVAYHAWAFFAPALEERERRVIVPSLYLGLVLFAAGVAMAYFVVLPLTIRFLILFGTQWFELELTADAYLAMVWRLLVVFGAIFELPVVVMILSALGLVTPAFLRAKRRHAIVIMVVAASILSPGDLISLTLLLLGPMIVLYELGILLSAMVRRERIDGLPLLVPLAVLLEARNRLAESAAERHRASPAR